MTMRIKKNSTLASVMLLFSLLLAAIPDSPLDAAESDYSANKEARMITDFTADTPDLGWWAQNDNVMGGRSKGGFDLQSGELIFAGSTNTNGGGFSSIRTTPFELDLSNQDGIELRLKGDGRSYIWQLQTNARYRGYRVSYWAGFDTREGEWSTVRIPFANFYPQVRGFRLDNPPLDSSAITELGLYIYDQKDGPFELHLDTIKGYKADAT
ncbi:MAG: CIA30 family protein [Gammaproteobacteria bacterium]|nr:CIA30 family protein [Gammaproteobacteria bacterium]